MVAAGEGAAVAILNRNESAFYCVPASVYAAMIEQLEDIELNAIADARQGEAVVKIKLSELLGWHLSRTGKATTAASALEHALVARFGTLGRVPASFLLRSDNDWSSLHATTQAWYVAMA